MADKDIEVEPVKEVKLHKVKFISTLFSFDFRYFVGDVAELTDEVYEIAKRYNSIEDV